MSSKKGLGRGLSALIPPVTPEEENGEGNIRQVRVKDIRPNPRQPRQDFCPENLDELRQSIKKHGLIQPVVVRPLEDGRYELVAGERRWRACQELGLETIPAVVREVANQEAAELALIENIQRQDLGPLEEARAFQTLIEEFAVTQEDLAERVGKSRPYISNMLRLLSLDRLVQQYLAEGMLTAGHARALLSLAGEEQVRCAHRIIAQKLSVRQTEELVRGLARSDQKELPAKPPQGAGPWKGFGDRLSDWLGTQVRISDRDGRGKIEISYHSREELERLLEVLLPRESL